MNMIVIIAQLQKELDRVKGLPAVNSKLLSGDYLNVGGAISLLLTYIFPLSGILLLFFLISAGFDLMTAAGDPKKTEAAKEKLTSAIVGFIIVFTAFWIYQIVKYVLGIA